MVSLHILPTAMLPGFLKLRDERPGALTIFWWDENPRETISLAKKAGFRVFVLRVADTELNLEDARRFGLRVFDRRRAFELARFLVEAYGLGVREFVFVCEAGRSRSAGAAQAFETWLRAQGEDPEVFKVFASSPNQLIRENLKEALFRAEGWTPERFLAELKDLAKSPIEWDHQGYPTEESLRKLRGFLEGYRDRVKLFPKKWQKRLSDGDVVLFLRVLLENAYPDAVRIETERNELLRKNVLVLEYHTFGWSGNEEIISLLEKVSYGILWNLFWRKEEIGGHYYFMFPDRIARKLQEFFGNCSFECYLGNTQLSIE